MIQEFTLSRDRAIINFSVKYCDSREKILSSYAFRRVVESFIYRIKKEDPILYDFFITDFATEENLTTSLIDVIKLITVCSVEELLEVNNKYAPFSKIRVFLLN